MSHLIKCKRHIYCCLRRLLFGLRATYKQERFLLLRPSWFATLCCLIVCFCCRHCCSCRLLFAAARMNFYFTSVFLVLFCFLFALGCFCFVLLACLLLLVTAIAVLAAPCCSHEEFVLHVQVFCFVLLCLFTFVIFVLGSCLSAPRRVCFGFYIACLSAWWLIACLIV